MALGDDDASWDMCTGSAPESSRTDMIAHLITCLLQPQPPPPRRRWWCQHAAACGLHEHDTEVSAQRNHKVWRQSGGQLDCRPVYGREGASLML